MWREKKFFTEKQKLRKECVKIKQNEEVFDDFLDD
jgi:hypothetical protein